MPNYQNAKIYELVCLTTGLRYIGSTTERYLSRRLATHVRDCKKREHPCSAVNIIKAGNYKINLLEKYPCNDVNELTTREYEYMKTNECVNKLRGLGRNKEKEREYKLKNKDAINAKKREWRLKKKIPTVGFDPTTSGLCPIEITDATS